MISFFFIWEKYIYVSENPLDVPGIISPLFSINIFMSSPTEFNNICTTVNHAEESQNKWECLEIIPALLDT